MEVSTILEINMENYLVQFMHGYFHSVGDVIHVNKSNFLGHLIYDLVTRVPQDCHYRPHKDVKKVPLRIEIGFLGSDLERRKNPLYNYYLPRSRQLLIEKYVRAFFDELLCAYIEVEQHDNSVERKSLFESFCSLYRIDFGRYYDTLQKKYYRYRQEKIAAIAVVGSVQGQLCLF